MPRANTQPVRISSELVETLKMHTKTTGRSVPAETEFRLRESLGRDAWATVARQLTPRARAIGQLTSFLANELAAYSEPRERAEALKRGIGRLFDRIVIGDLNATADPVEMIADYWWLQMTNAHERAQEDGVVLPVTPEQKWLLEVRKDLAPTVGAKRTADGQRGRKERK